MPQDASRISTAVVGFYEKKLCARLAVGNPIPWQKTWMQAIAIQLQGYRILYLRELLKSW